MHQATFEQRKKKKHNSTNNMRKYDEKRSESWISSGATGGGEGGRWMELLMELVPMATASQRGFISKRRLRTERCRTSCDGLTPWTHRSCSHTLYGPVDEDVVNHQPSLTGHPSHKS